MFSSNHKPYEYIRAAYPVIKETVPQSARGYNSNNKYPGMPPLMNDGRSITTSAQSNSSTNADIIRQNNIQSNWQYRKYLQSNAVEVMKSNFRSASNDAGYHVRHVDVIDNQSNQFSSKSVSPALYSSVVDTKQVIGQSNSDLKQLYMSRDILDSRRISPVITQASLLHQRFLASQAPKEKA